MSETPRAMPRLRILNFRIVEIRSNNRQFIRSIFMLIKTHYRMNRGTVWCNQMDLDVMNFSVCNSHMLLFVETPEFHLG